MGTRIQTDSVMHPRSSSSGLNTSASVAVTVSDFVFTSAGCNIWNIRPEKSSWLHSCIAFCDDCHFRLPDHTM